VSPARRYQESPINCAAAYLLRMIGIPTEGSRKDLVSIPLARILATTAAVCRSSSSARDPGAMNAHCPAAARLLGPPACEDLARL
jgi:hypothetical protein